MDKSTYCSSLWNHQMIETTGGSKPCCRFVMPKGYNPNLNNQSLIEIFNNSFMNELRAKSISGQRIEGCQRCYEEEDNNKKSLRQRVSSNPASNFVNFENPIITYLELAISNNCNLMCRMCNSKFSYKLFDEEISFFGKASTETKITRSNLDAAYEALPNLRYIKMTGGEPLIIPEQWRFLEHAIEKGYSKNITLNYSTNCTVWPKEKIFNIWGEFQKVDLAVSLDSIVPEENEYQRHLTNHQESLEIIKKFKEISSQMSNLTIIGRPTVTVFNIFNMLETVDWFVEQRIPVNPTHVTHPDWLSVTILPTKEKEKIKQKFLNYKHTNEKTKEISSYLLNYMFSSDNSHLLEKFKNHTKFLDQKRGQDFKKACPYYDF